MMRVGVVGATGYAGAELIRLLIRHPRVELAKVVSSSQSGTRLDELHPALLGCTELEAESFDPQALAELDAVFVGVPHGKAAPLCSALDAAGAKHIFDLSRDHRHAEGWIYGLAEWAHTNLSGAKRVAVPGCFATAISMASAPFVAEGVVDGPIRVVAATGSTGLGTTPSKSGHHPERFTNLKAYKVLSHQHCPEVEAFLHGVGKFDGLKFVPLSAPVDRGILATVMSPLSEDLGDSKVQAVLQKAYGHHPLVRVRQQSPELRHVRGTGFCDVAAFATDREVVVITAIDNLGKGASAQAVQCLNHAFDWPVETGLELAACLP